MLLLRVNVNLNDYNGKTVYYPGAVLEDPLGIAKSSAQKFKDEGVVEIWKPEGCVPVEYDADCNPIEL